MVHRKGEMSVFGSLVRLSYKANIFLTNKKSVTIKENKEEQNKTTTKKTLTKTVTIETSLNPGHIWPL